MATLKNTTAAFERFVIGAAELASAKAWRDATDNEADAAVTFYKEVIVKHDIDLEGLKPRKNGMGPRTNTEQAAFDFTRKIYATFKVGAACAAHFFDATAGDVILTPEGKRKPQPKRALRDSVFGSKEWGPFLNRMILIRDGEQVAKRAPSTKSTDRKFVADRGASIIARLLLKGELQDGTIDAAQAPKLAKALDDLFVAYKFWPKK